MYDFAACTHAHTHTHTHTCTPSLPYDSILAQYKPWRCSSRSWCSIKTTQHIIMQQRHTIPCKPVLSQWLAPRCLKPAAVITWAGMISALEQAWWTLWDYSYCPVAWAGTNLVCTPLLSSELSRWQAQQPSVEAASSVLGPFVWDYMDEPVPEA